MVVALVLSMFVVFIVIDIFLNWRRKKVLKGVGETLQRALGKIEPRWIAGFRLPETLYYHKGHTWVHMAGPEEAYVGVDDFARRLLGKSAQIKPPPVGTRLQQGEGSLTVSRTGEKVQLLSPVSGVVVAANPDLKGDGQLVHRDPYGSGWIYKIRSPRLLKELSNLLSDSLAVRWMEDTRDRFQHRLMLASGSVIQDGGSPVEDLAADFSPAQWRSMVEEFLLQRPGL